MSRRACRRFALRSAGGCFPSASQTLAFRRNLCSTSIPAAVLRSPARSHVVIPSPRRRRGISRKVSASFFREDVPIRATVRSLGALRQPRDDNGPSFFVDATKHRAKRQQGTPVRSRRSLFFPNGSEKFSTRSKGSPGSPLSAGCLLPSSQPPSCVHPSTLILSSRAAETARDLTQGLGVRFQKK